MITIERAKEMVEEVQLNDVYELNDWEADFIESIHKWLFNGFGLTEKQTACLQRIYDKLTDSGYVPIHNVDERTPYDVLGVSEDAPFEEILRTFRELVMQCHPDRAAGLHPDIVAFAQERMKKINAAFECIKKERGR